VLWLGSELELAQTALKHHDRGGEGLTRVKGPHMVEKRSYTGVKGPHRSERLPRRSGAHEGAGAHRGKRAHRGEL